MSTGYIVSGSADKETVRPGYVEADGTGGSAMYARSPVSSTPECVDIVVHCCPNAVGPARIAGWSLGKAYLGLNSSNQLVMSVQGTSGVIGGTASRDPVPGLAVGVWVWLRGRVDRASGLVEYWYSYQKDFPTSWTDLGIVTGTGAGQSLESATDHNVYLGRSGSTEYFDGKVDYYRESLVRLGTVNLEIDLRESTTLPAGVSLVSGGQFTSAVEEYQRLPLVVTNRQQFHPLRRGLFQHKSGTDGGIDSGHAPVYNLTGDMDIRWFGTIDDHTLNGFYVLMSKWDQLGESNKSWYINIHQSQVQFYFSTSGSASTASSGLATIPWQNGEKGGIRVTRQKSTGVVSCYFSRNGVDWELAGIASGFNTGSDAFASNIGIGVSGWNGGWVGSFLGSTEWAEVRDGIDGTPVYRIGPRGIELYPYPRHTTQIFPEVGSTLPQIKANCYVLPQMQLQGAFYRGEERLWPAGDGFLTTVTTSGSNYIEKASEVNRFDADLISAGGFTCVACIRADDPWETTSRHLIAKTGTFQFYTAEASFAPTTDPRIVVLIYHSSGSNFHWRWSDPLPDAYQEWIWLGATVDFSTTPGTALFKFWISWDGVTWIPWGSGSNSAGTNPLSPNTNPLRFLNTTPYECRYLSLRNGFGTNGTIGGVENITIDRDSLKGVGRRATTFESKQGDTLTVVRAGSSPLRIHSTIGEDPLVARWGESVFGDTSRWGA